MATSKKGKNNLGQERIRLEAGARTLTDREAIALADGSLYDVSAARRRLLNDPASYHRALDALLVHVLTQPSIGEPVGPPPSDEELDAFLAFYLTEERRQEILTHVNRSPEVFDRFAARRAELIADPPKISARLQAGLQAIVGLEELGELVVRSEPDDSFSLELRRPPPKGAATAGASRDVDRSKAGERAVAEATPTTAAITIESRHMLIDAMATGTAKAPTVEFRIRYRQTGEPVADLTFDLALGSGKQATAITDSDGCVRIALSSTSVRLRAKTPPPWALKVVR